MGKVKMQAMMDQACAGEAEEMDDCCAEEASAIPADTPVIEKKVEACCVTSVTGMAMQYDSPAPEGQKIIALDIIFNPAVTMLNAPVQVAEQPLLTPIHSPPRDIPLTNSALLI